MEIGEIREIKKIGKIHYSIDRRESVRILQHSIILILLLTNILLFL